MGGRGPLEPHVYSQKTKVQHACWWKEHSRDHYMWDVSGSNKPYQLSLQTYLISHFLHCLQWQHDWIIFNPNKLDLTHQRRDVNKTILVMNQQETSLLGSKQLETNVLELQYIYMLANHDQKVYSRFRLLKVYVCVKLESSNYRKLLFNFYKARSIEN